MLPGAEADPIFGELPPTFTARLVHRQSVLRLPDGAVPLTANDHERHQAFRFGPSAWGVQFHPEFSAAAMRGYIETLGSDLRDEGKDPSALSADVIETPDASRLMRNFVRHVQSAACAGV
ncbi:hypothetical protein WKW77_33355 [Variovorax ureilyticus]|uniref:Glutamine amidotransferase domain-containing protein n=1 Tax=Variovorax ureilyticus TaxID=1836198 RepID=A0ABU8VS57_9BURK